MQTIEEFLQSLSNEELTTIGLKAKEVLKQRKQEAKEKLASQVLELYNECNKLGKRIYNLKEIGKILNLPVYTVTQIVKQYKLNEK